MSQVLTVQWENPNLDFAIRFGIKYPKMDFHCSEGFCKLIQIWIYRT